MNRFPVKLLGTTFCFVYLPSAWSLASCWREQGGQTNKQTNKVHLQNLCPAAPAGIRSWPMAEAWHSSCSVPSGRQQSWDILRGTMTQLMPTADHMGYQLWHDHLDPMSLLVSSFFPAPIAKQVIERHVLKMLLWKLVLLHLTLLSGD